MPATAAISSAPTPTATASDSSSLGRAKASRRVFFFFLFSFFFSFFSFFPGVACHRFLPTRASNGGERQAASERARQKYEARRLEPMLN